MVFKLQSKNVGDVFWDSAYLLMSRPKFSCQGASNAKISIYRNIKSLENVTTACLEVSYCQTLRQQLTSYVVTANIITRESSYCFQRVLAVSILSVCPSVTRVDQSKTVQDRITKFLPSAAWKTLVSGTVKLFHKFEGGHPERGR